MPELTTQEALRTRKVKTIIDTVEPVEQKNDSGLGMSPLEYVKQLPEEQLPLCKLYIYRVDPKTTASYIDLVSDRIDEQILEERYGGKVLAVKLQHKTASGLKEGYQGRIEVLTEPKYTKREIFANSTLAPAPAAAPTTAAGVSEAMLSKLIDKLLEEKLSAQQSNASAIEATVKMMESASNRAIDVVAAQVPKQGSNSLLETINALKDAGLIGNQNGSKDSIRETLSLLKDLGIVAPANKSQSLIEQLGELQKLKEFFSGEGGGAEGAKKSNIYDVLSALVDKGPALVDRAVFIAQENARRKQAAAAAANGQQPAAVQVLPAAQPARQQELQPAAAETAAPSAPPATANDADEPFKKRVVEMIRENTDPVIALNFIEGWNPAVAAMLHMFTPEQIRNFIASDPVLKQAVELPTFEEWFVVFLDEIEQDKKDAQESSEAPPQSIRKKPN